MANKIQIRRDTAFAWSNVNPILVQGEPGLETDTGKFKFGNGANNWVDLPYSNFEDTVYNDFHVEGHTYLNDTTISGTFILNGNTQYIQAENSVYTDNLLEIHNPGGEISNTWTSNDGKDVGIRLHYYNGADKNAALFMDNGDWRLKWVVEGTENAGQFDHTGFGDFQANTFYGNLVSTTVVSNGVDLNSYIQSAYNKANTTSANTIYTQGVDVSQNTRLTTIETINTNQNTSIGIVQGGLNTANANISVLFAIDTAQNTSINSAIANTIYTQGVDISQNTRLTTIETVNTNQNTSINSAVANTIYIQGVDASQNTKIQAAFDKANTTPSNTFTNLTVSANASFNGLTQVQQLDLPYTAKTAATGTVTHDCSVGQVFYHTSISGNFTPNFTNLGLSSGYVTEIKLYLVQSSSSRTVTSMQIGGVTKTINWYNAVNPTYSTNAVDVVTFEILLVNTTYTVFGKVEKYDSVAAGGGGGGGG